MDTLSARLAEIQAAYNEPYPPNILLEFKKIKLQLRNSDSNMMNLSYSDSVSPTALYYEQQGANPSTGLNVSSRVAQFPAKYGRVAKS